MWVQAKLAKGDKNVWVWSLYGLEEGLAGGTLNSPGSSGLSWELRGQDEMSWH